MFGCGLFIPPIAAYSFRRLWPVHSAYCGRFVRSSCDGRFIPLILNLLKDESAATDTVNRQPAGAYKAPSPSSPVRMRMALATGVMKILPSPMLPVRELAMMMSTARWVSSSRTTVCSLTLGSISTT